MAVCDKCGEEMTTVFEKGGIWLCRKCYVKEVLAPKEAEQFVESRAEALADALLDDYWSEEVDEPRNTMNEWYRRV